MFIRDEKLSKLHKWYDEREQMKTSQISMNSRLVESSHSILVCVKMYVCGETFESIKSTEYSVDVILIFCQTTDFVSV